MYDKIKIYSMQTSHETNMHARPEGFSYENCWYNLLNSIHGDHRAEITVMFDGELKPDHYISRYKGGRVIVNQNNGMWPSWVKTWQQIKEDGIQENELIYILENDYKHVYYEWTGKVLELFNAYTDMNYVSLYDHPDKYDEANAHLQSYIFISKTHHWRTVPSTCGSFIINKKIFEEDYEHQTTVYGDHDKFTQLLEQKGRYILTPIPSLSTHMMSKYMAPCIEWKSV